MHVLAAVSFTQMLPLMPEATNIYVSFAQKTNDCALKTIWKCNVAVLITSGLIDAVVRIDSMSPRLSGCDFRVRSLADFRELEIVFEKFNHELIEPAVVYC
jgi:hypothetical protein